MDVGGFGDLTGLVSIIGVRSSVIFSVIFSCATVEVGAELGSFSGQALIGSVSKQGGRGELPMADTWDDATKQAMKILGNKGQIPDAKALRKFYADVVMKTFDTFAKVRDDLEAKIADLEGQLEKFSAMVDQFEAKVEKDDLGLNGNDKEESKTIDKARPILVDALNIWTKTADDNIKNLKDAGRHLILLSKYKQDKSL